ncbi:MAG: type II toxin-antitoxin system HicB family antitoxin [Cytophagales bacterium]|nr:MAG: type II toxin-antitoxin system HicB family antitoxin [Cytophagales bacterium]
MNTFRHGLYRVIITKDEETGYFVAEVPTLSPCTTHGTTMEEAISMVQEAIEAVIESRTENGYPIPDDTLELEQQTTTIQAIVPIAYTVAQAA